MRVFAYCGATFEKSTRRAAGVIPLTCPPTTANTFQPGLLENKDLIIFDLHGEPGEPYWFETTTQDIFGLKNLSFQVPALRAETIRKVDLGDAVVFALNCYLGDDDSPMLDALLDAGASYVIGGEGKNWTVGSTVGASQLAYLFRKSMEKGLDPLKSLTRAKKGIKKWFGLDVVLGHSERVKATADTLEFKAYVRV
jgi:hypothetical protein